MAQKYYFCIAMKNITLHDKTFRLFIEAAKIDQAIADMADRMNTDLKDEKPLFLCMLNGAFMFASDLIKRITVAGSQISFVKMTSYQGTCSSGEVKELIGLAEEIAGRTVVILEDIIDSGRSMTHLLEYLKTRKPKQVIVATLFHKPRAVIYPVSIRYVGIELENDFIVGRGLDYDGLGRNFPDLYVLNS